MKTMIKNIGNKNVKAKVEEPLRFHVETLFNLLTKVEDKLVDGFSIQVGWSIFSLCKYEDCYQIITPDYTKNPFKDMSEDLTITLWVQLEQAHCLRRLNIEGELIKFKDKIVIAKNVLQQDEVYLQRSSGYGEGSSGWYIGPINEEEESGELETIYAYELLKMKPALIQVLALPYDYLVVFEKDKIKAILNECDVDIWSEIER
ncbi:hypothetical protein OB975_10695 [Bacillus cereus]|uniref:immunity protein Imm33 domain-containing protein n=1 Tax=Bacillus cereus group TaxID=86661 RepID=UPI0032F1A72F|nr:hypothetical protein [Bacillus cereus]MCU5479707.1 hypothetical protein [Bacillus cereus]HDR4604247.1 hypothetical protein [Bacillus cereus]HDR4632862.1 hypothetical protein [Bacillus cereus]